MASVGTLASHTRQRNVGGCAHHGTIISSPWLIRLRYLNYANALVPNWLERPLLYMAGLSRSLSLIPETLCSSLVSVWGGGEGGLGRAYSSLILCEACVFEKAYYEGGGGKFSTSLGMLLMCNFMAWERVMFWVEDLSWPPLHLLGSIFMLKGTP